MKREPMGLYLLRLIISACILFFLVMVYWSSALVEEGLQEIKKELQQLEKRVLQPSRQRVISQATEDFETKKALQSHMDERFPNILTEDLYYTTTLPKQLGENFVPWGVRQQATYGYPDHLHPFSGFAEVSGWTRMCNVALADLHFGIYETMTPDMALKVEARPVDGSTNPEFWVHLREGVFWQPLDPDWFSDEITLSPHFLKKHPVTAYDFKFYFDAIMNSHVQLMGAIASRTTLEDIDEFRVIDDLTFVVRWKAASVREPDGSSVEKVLYDAKLSTGQLMPLARFVYQYYADGTKIVEDDNDPNTYRVNSVWAQNFSEHWARNIIVSCGPWIFDGITEQRIQFVRNPDHYQPLAVLVEGLEIAFKNTDDAIWQEFKNGSLDTHGLSSNEVLELEDFLDSPQYRKQEKEGLAIHRIDYPAYSYVWIGWNQAKPYFKSRRVRQAMTMAIDRRRIIQQNLNGMGIETNGTFYRYSPAYDTSLIPWPYDTFQAKRLLEEEGWYDQDGDGILDKEIDGKIVPFRFYLTYYVKNPTTKSICEYVSMALKEIGVDCILNGVDIADLSQVFDDKSFDALYLAWSLGQPPDDPKQLWSSSGAKEKGSSNAVGFANKEADQIIDQLLYEDDPQRRLELYHRFSQILHEEAPYTFLYTPKAAFLYRDYVENVFIPVLRQDLIPGANVGQPLSRAFWLRGR